MKLRDRTVGLNGNFLGLSYPDHARSERCEDQSRVIQPTPVPN